MDLRPSGIRRAGIALLAFVLGSVLVGPAASSAYPAGNADWIRTY
jgi:hypothetical protein